MNDLDGLLELRVLPSFSSTKRFLERWYAMAWSLVMNSVVLGRGDARVNVAVEENRCIYVDLISLKLIFQ